MVILSFICALILSLLASALATPQEVAKELDRSKQMLIAANILDHQGHFLMKDEQGKTIYAKYGENGRLVPGTSKDYATNQEILEVVKERIKPYLINKQGKLVSFEDANVDKDDYINTHKKEGYYHLPEKLIYEILPNPSPDSKDEKPIGYVIPVNGFGLWDAIYGYVAIQPDGDQVIGISWYDQKETPGLGANIAESSWQSNFPGKHIFQASASGQLNPKTAPLGITVVKGKVAEVLGDSPKAKSAVDGMAGATLTGNGVTDAYKDVLNAYRPFLVKQYEENKSEQS